MISLENLGRLSALGLKGSGVARRIQKLGNREHLYSCFVRRKPHMMKFKPNQTRTYDGEGFKKRAACLCFKNDREDEVKLREKYKCRWWLTCTTTTEWSNRYYKLF